MVDDMTPNGSASPSEGAKPGRAGFLGTRNGRMIAAAVALVAVLLAAGAIVYFFVLAPQEPEDLLTQIPPAGSMTGTSSAQATEAAPVNRRAKPLSSTFVFRDIFVPTVKATLEPTAGALPGSGEPSEGVDPDVPEGVLLVRSVSTVDGVPMATFVWNGQIYTVGEGDRLGDTPWRVVSIEGRTVTLLYGDSRVTLTVGQGVSK